MKYLESSEIVGKGETSLMYGGVQQAENVMVFYSLEAQKRADFFI